MKFFSIFLILFFLLLSSCQTPNKSDFVSTDLQDTIQKIDKKNSASTGVSLRSNAKKEVENWKEYNLVDAMLTRYFSISNEEALSNAKELSGLVTHLKDSIRDEKLNTPPIRARINILHNECLRLNDMVAISAISPQEVIVEVDKILKAFSAFNAKLNSIYAVDELENELELDPDFIKIFKETPDKTLLDTDKHK